MGFLALIWNMIYGMFLLIFCMGFIFCLLWFFLGLLLYTLGAIFGMVLDGGAIGSPYI